MLNLPDKSSCVGCNACAQACQSHSVVMTADSEGFKYPKIDISTCSDCGKCSNVCFLNKKREPIKDFEIYAAKHKDEKIKYKSTSGGIFTPLAEAVIAQGGVVFGAAFDENFVVCHSAAQTKSDLQKFRKSKYVQSDIGNTYVEAQKALDAGKKVLFSGVPCQISGLKSFLRKEYDNLYCVDLICSGVSSPLVWQKYLDELEDRMNSKLVSVISREKEIDNKALLPHQGNITLKVLFENGKSVYQHSGTDANTTAFYAGFLSRLYLRPACHICPVRGFTSVSDIMLGDFWRLERIYPDFFDTYEDGTIIPFGVSEVIIQSDKGASLFESVKDSLDCMKIDKNLLLDAKSFGNWFQLFHSFKPHHNRRDFFAQLPETTETSKLIRDMLNKRPSVPVPVNALQINYELLRDWMYKKQLNRSISNYLKQNGYKDIAIYGLGEIGQLFLWEIEADADVNIVCVIDVNAKLETYVNKFVLANIPLVHPSEELQEVDAIVVCVPSRLVEIEAALLNKNIKAPIISIGKLVHEA